MSNGKGKWLTCPTCQSKVWDPCFSRIDPTCSVCHPPTIRQAFERAGYRVPDEARIVRYPDIGLWLWADHEKDLYADFGEEGWDEPISDPSQWCPAFGPNHIDVSNLPAVDAKEQLPDQVTSHVFPKVVDRG